MIAAPRCCTVVTNSPLRYSSSLTSSRTDLPPAVAWLTSGYWVDEWLPQMMQFLTSETKHAGALGYLTERAVVVQAGQAGDVLLGDLGRIVGQDQRVGVGGVGHDHNLTSGLACSCRADAWPL